MIQKGTKVTIRTTNGGVITGVLDHTYRPTYGATIIVPHGHVTIQPWRIAAIVEA